MKKAFAWLVLAALVLGFGADRDSRAQEKAKGEPYRPKIALVNIAKVLKDYNKANYEGKRISDRRMEYLKVVNDQRTKLNEMNKDLAKAPDAAKKDAITRDMTAITRQIEDLDGKAQKELGDMSNNTVISVYKEINETIAAIAEANGLELVLGYPDASDPKDANSAIVAQLKLQTPALMPFYHKNVDITDYVVKTLNSRYPSPGAAGASATTTDKNVTPAAGTNK